MQGKDSGGEPDRYVLLHAVEALQEVVGAIMAASRDLMAEAGIVVGCDDPWDIDVEDDDIADLYENDTFPEGWCD